MQTGTGTHVSTFGRSVLCCVTAGITLWGSVNFRHEMTLNWVAFPGCTLESRDMGGKEAPPAGLPSLEYQMAATLPLCHTVHVEKEVSLLGR